MNPDEEKIDVHFSPPLYIQRYLYVQNLIYDEKFQGQIRKVVDFGCAELQFFKYLKSIQNIQEVLEVDVDVTTLKENMHRVHPLTCDYLARRIEKLDVHVLEGNIKDPDPRLLGTDMVVGIEIIEHLYPDTLEAMPYNIFGFIRPKIAVFTTPNVDFNVLFRCCGYRHPDHKFEWTREQFEDWARNICDRFPDYSVVFDGLGQLSIADSKNLGCCSQVAIFTLNSASLLELEDDNSYESYGICTYESCSASSFQTKGIISRDYSRPCYYNSLLEVNYPYDSSQKVLNDEKILEEIIYLLNVYGTEWGLYYNCVTEKAEIPLTFLHKFIEHLCSYSKFIDIIKEKYSIDNCLVENNMEQCVIYPVPSEEDYFESDSENNFEYYNEPLTTDEPPDWENTKIVT